MQQSLSDVEPAARERLTLLSESLLTTFAIESNTGRKESTR